MIVASGCGCASNPALKLSAKCDRKSHTAGADDGYRLVSHEELRRLTAEKEGER